MKEKSFIPFYSLKERNKGAMEIKQIDENTGADEVALKGAAHRDDHYILIFQEYGSSKLMVDFKEVCIEGCAIFSVLPGQVHYGISTIKSKGWFIALDVSWINESFRPVFQESMDRYTPVSMMAEDAVLLKNSIVLLSEVYGKGINTQFYNHTLRAVADGCISLFASFYYKKEHAAAQSNLRIFTITRQFRSLLLISFRMMKNPSEYATALNISASYLNEAVKQASGYPVSYWIHQEIILEAKRMLFYTNNTVKEIAHSLGYQDHTYFIRLFSKIAGMPPLQFRQQYRK